MNLERLIEANQIARTIQTTDIQSFILKNKKKYDADLLNLIADQFVARQKAKYKLPTWYANENTLVPPPLSVEQASSEITANYKAQVFGDFLEKRFPRKCIDLTGGMGLDTFALAKVFDEVVYVEQNSLLAQIAKYNFEVLGQKNIEVLSQDAVIFIHSLNHPFSHSLTHYYLDPHRRDAAKNKVFKIEDCEPNLLSIKHLLRNYMVKFSPMLDIKLALEQLENIAEVHVIAVENEVKELLFLSEKTAEKTRVRNFVEFNLTPNPLSKKEGAFSALKSPLSSGEGVGVSPAKFRTHNKTKIVCVNFLSNEQKQVFTFDFESEEKAKIEYAKPSNFIYEPNAAIMKAGAFRSVAERFGISKVAPNSHLYTSENLVENFAGRSFSCVAVCRLDKKEILSYLPNKKANISTRNFPMKPEEIKKKLGLQDGGEYYLFATENHEKQKIVLICKKVSSI